MSERRPHNLKLVAAAMRRLVTRRPMQDDAFKFTITTQFRGITKKEFHAAACIGGLRPDTEKDQPTLWWRGEDWAVACIRKGTANARKIQEWRRSWIKDYRHVPTPAESPSAYVWCPGCRHQFDVTDWADHQPAMLQEMTHRGNGDHSPREGLTIDNLPPGIYPDNIYREGDVLYAVDLVHDEGCACGRVRVMRIEFRPVTAGSWRVIERRDDDAVTRLDPASRLTIEEQRQIGRRFSHCVAFQSFGRRCGRRLTSPESVERGMGPTCFARYLAEHRYEEVA